MLISFEKKFIFVANLKTASSSIEEALEKYSDIKLRSTWSGKHMPLRQVDNILNTLPNEAKNLNYFSFGVMREPLSYLISIYNSHNKPDFDGEDYSTKDMPFPEFIEEWCINKKSWQVAPQRNRFLKNDGEIGLDFICIFEKLNEDLAYVFDKLDLTESLPRSNVSPRIISIKDIDEITRDRVYKLYRDDYILYNKLLENNTIANRNA